MLCMYFSGMRLGSYKYVTQYDWCNCFFDEQHGGGTTGAINKAEKAPISSQENLDLDGGILVPPRKPTNIVSIP